MPSGSGQRTMQKKCSSLAGKRVWVAGHKGFIGSALEKRLSLLDCELIVEDKENLNLLEQATVNQWVGDNKFDVIFLAAAKVGGIEANRTQPAEFLYENLTIGTNVVHAAYQIGVQRLVNLGSSCFYPKNASQPLKEECLLSGELEPTNEGYALAKIVIAKLCQFYSQQYGMRYQTFVPTNIYGPGDHFHPLRSHVIPALIRKFYLAKINRDKCVSMWGTGTPIRQFLYIDDAVDGILHAYDKFDDTSLINIAGGDVVSISELSALIANKMEYEGSLEFDTSKPDGMMKKALCHKKMHELGWQAKTSLDEGLMKTIEDFHSRQSSGSFGE